MIRSRVTGLLVLTMLLAACGAPGTPATASAPSATGGTDEPTESQGSEPRGDQVLRMALATSPTDLVAGDARGVSRKVYEWMFDALVRIDANGEIQPALATDWEFIDDTTIEFNLREGVTFHNGMPFDAEDVKFTLEYNVDPDNARAPGNRIRAVEEVEILDPLTVVVHLNVVDPVILANLSVNHILSKRYFDEVGLDEYSLSPVGTGMFSLADYSVDERYVLVRFEDYWGTLPQIAGLELVIRAEESTRIAALQTGEVDVADGIPPDQIPTLEQEGIQIARAFIGQVVTMDLFGLNRNSGVPGHPALADSRVREAIYYAVDREALHEAFMDGQSELVECGLTGPDAFGFSEEAVQEHARPYDPGRARELLAEAGYPDGFEVNVVSGLGDIVKEAELVEAVTGYLNDVGITTTIENLEASVWLERYFAGELGPIFFHHWTYFPTMDLSAPLVHFSANTDLNFWTNDELDELWLLQQQEPDPDAREGYLKDIHEIFCDEAVNMPIWRNMATWGMSPQVSGLELLPDLSVQVQDVTIADD